MNDFPQVVSEEKAEKAWADYCQAERDNPDAISISHFVMGDFHKKIEKLNRKSARYGLPEISVTFHGVFPVYDSNMPGLWELYAIWYLYTVKGEKIQVDNGQWEILAKIENLDGQNLVHFFGEKDSSDFDFDSANAAMTCDHCGISNNRQYVLLFTNEKGDFKQVGGNCAADFLGYNPDSIVAYYDSIRNLDRMSHEKRKREYISPLSLVAQSIAVTEKDRGYAKGATIGATVAAIFDMTIKIGRYDVLASEYYKVTAAHVEKAQKVLDWLESENAYNDFMHNMKVLGSANALPIDKIGPLCYASTAYENHLKKQSKREALYNAGYYGTVGKWEKVTLIKIFDTGYSTQYGYTFLVSFREEKTGKCIVWKSGTETAENMAEMQKGEKVTVNMKIKKHDDYNGQNQTIVTMSTRGKKAPIYH